MKDLRELKDFDDARCMNRRGGANRVVVRVGDGGRRLLVASYTTITYTQPIIYTAQDPPVFHGAKILP